MDNILEQKEEALKAMGEYLDNLIPSIETLCSELKGDRKPDTDDFQKKCIDGLNWVIEIYNRISDILDKDRIPMEKDALNEKLIELGGALKDKNDAKTAESMENAVLPFLKALQDLAK